MGEPRDMMLRYAMEEGRHGDCIVAVAFEMVMPGNLRCRARVTGEQAKLVARVEEGARDFGEGFADGEE